RRQAAAARVFQPVSGPQGFEYVYFPRGRKATPTELRKKLRLLGVDTRRALDICFPAKAVVGILVHLQYKDELVSCLGKAKIQPIEDFDPLDPAHLGDPKFAAASNNERQYQMARIHADHCEAALRFLRFPVAVAVSREFLDQGWISDQAVSEILHAKKDAPRRPHHDDEMENIASTIHDVLRLCSTNHVLFITETWLLPSSGCLNTSWSQFHVYGVPVEGGYRGTQGVSALVSPLCPVPVIQVPLN
ncbi:hypothetical protein K501DRAFT_149100, partial [Backusella circina FSU 941]